MKAKLAQAGDGARRNARAGSSKKRSTAKAGGHSRESSTKAAAPEKPKPGPSAKSKPAGKTDDAELARSTEKAKKLEALDAEGAQPPGPAKGAQRLVRGKAPEDFAASTVGTRSAAAARNSDFPNTYIKQISISLDDPDHSMRLTWTGPKAASQETGPFRTSPGAGNKGINCDITSTSRRSGTRCTPKGTFYVEGFKSRLNSDARATNVTWFQQWRGIALHYFPSVPTYPASHGCIRIQLKRVAQLIQQNSRVGKTRVVVSGNWTKPAKQW